MKDVKGRLMQSEVTSKGNTFKSYKFKFIGELVNSNKEKVGEETRYINVKLTKAIRSEVEAYLDKAEYNQVDMVLHVGNSKETNRTAFRTMDERKNDNGQYVVKKDVDGKPYYVMFITKWNPADFLNEPLEFPKGNYVDDDDFFGGKVVDDADAPHEGIDDSDLPF